MSVESAFKSTHPSVLEWKAEADRLAREWSAAMSGLRSEYPGYKVMVREVGFSRRRRFAGLKGSGTPGEGWRFDKKGTVWLPDKRTRVGKALAARFDELELSWPPTPGMPDTAVIDNKWHHPGLDEFDGVVWVSWGCPADAVRESGWSKQTLDEELWVEALLSEFYLAKESAA